MIRKSILILVLCLAVMSFCSGCDDKTSVASAKNNGQKNGVDDVLQAGVDKENGDVTEEPETITAKEIVSVDPDKETNKPEKGIDVDLTSLSSTMVYSEVYNMMGSPEEYVGKKVKMEGTYAMYHDDTTDKDYFACIIQDATACCQQGMEFQLTDDYKYPDDYPKQDSNITVVGVFDTYDEADGTYCTLKNAKLVKK